jgi:hypothetical protein
VDSDERNDMSAEEKRPLPSAGVLLQVYRRAYLNLLGDRAVLPNGRPRVIPWAELDEAEQQRQIGAMEAVRAALAVDSE